MRCAMMERILVSGTTEPALGPRRMGLQEPKVRARCGGSRRCNGCQCRDCRRGNGLRALVEGSASASSLVMRPFAPVPATLVRSRLLSFADLAHERR